MEKNTNTKKANTNTKRAAKRHLAALAKKAAENKEFFADSFVSAYRLGEHLKTSEIKAISPVFYDKIETLRLNVSEYAAAAYSDTASASARQKAIAKAKSAYNEMMPCIRKNGIRLTFSASDFDAILTIAENARKIDGKRTLAAVSAQTLCNRVLDMFAARIDGDIAKTAAERDAIRAAAAKVKAEERKAANKAKREEEKRAAAAAENAAVIDSNKQKIIAQNNVIGAKQNAEKKTAKKTASEKKTAKKTSRRTNKRAAA